MRTSSLTRYWFISTNHKASSKLALFTFLLAFVVIILGAYTRLTDAGLSCPDWPHCYGFVTAPHTATQIQDAAQRYPMMPINVKKAWTEMTHRYFAGTEGILILILSATFLLHRKAGDSKSTLIGLSLIALLCTQVMLGMLTVTEKLKPVIVLSHLLTGLSILSVLWWAFLDIYLSNHAFFVKKSSRFVVGLFWLALFVIIGQITLGGWVSTHYAGLACVDFPYCNGQVLPAMQWNNLNGDLITIHMLHRIGAMITAIYLTFFGLFLLIKTAFRVLGIHILALLTLQVTLGILNIVWLRPVWLALIHQSVGILLLLTIVTALVRVTFYRENGYVSWAA
jgi:cytochrome c oxidase assembly protein subunit 15